MTGKSTFPKFAWIQDLKMEIRDLQESDYPEVARIFQEGLDTGIATFETVVPDWNGWDRRFLPFARIIAEDEKEVLGWASLSAVSSRKAYVGVCEVTVYVGKTAGGRGVGKRLLEGLIARSEKEGIWTLQATIFAQNEVSIYLHKRMGFREVGRRERIGFRDGEWKDTVILERRSKIVGTPCLEGEAERE